MILKRKGMVRKDGDLLKIERECDVDDSENEGVAEVEHSTQKHDRFDDQTKH